MTTPSVVLVTDCEGPLVTNDHAREAAATFIPEGSRLFEQLSSFDDFTAYVQRRPGYNVGDSLRLLAPFLKAYGVTSGGFVEWTRRDGGISWMPGVQRLISSVTTANAPVYEVSASYHVFAQLVAQRLCLNPENCFCTYLDLDSFQMSELERARVRNIAASIIALPDLIPITGGMTEALNAPGDVLFAECEEWIWNVMATELDCCRTMLSKISVMGGQEKARAIVEIAEKEQVPLSNVMFVGDSITDVAAMSMVSKGNGVSVAFNGNAHAVAAAEYCAWGESADVLSELYSVFFRTGKEGLSEYVNECERKSRRVKFLHTGSVRSRPTLDEGSTDERVHEALRLSEQFRQRTRGITNSRLS